MIKGALRGEDAKWERFYRKYSVLAVYLGRLYHVPEQDLGDLTSRAMLKFWNGRDKFEYDPDKRFRAYFARIVHSVAMDMHRAHRRTNFLVEWPVDDEGRPLEFAAPAEVSKVIEAEDLTEIYQEARARLQSEVSDTLKYQCWQLHYEEGWAMKKIVQYLGVPQSSVYLNCNEVAAKLQLIFCKMANVLMPLPRKKSSEKKDSKGEHVTEAKILQYISGDCGILERLRISRHLDACPACAAWADELRARDTLQQTIVKGIRERQPVEQFAEQTLVPVMTRIAAQMQERRDEEVGE